MNIRRCAWALITILGLTWAVRVEADKNRPPTNRPALVSTNHLAMGRGREACYFKRPLAFEANLGQTARPVRYMARGNSHTLFLTGAEAVLTLRVPFSGQQSISRVAALHSQAVFPETMCSPSETAGGSGIAIRLRLIGAETNPAISGMQELANKVNYYLGSDVIGWRTNIPTYEKVKYHNVYPGIDLLYHGSQGELEYDFIVAPGANPDQIRFRLEGMRDWEMDAKGNLVLNVGHRQLVQHKPLVYQESDGDRQIIDGKFMLQSYPEEDEWGDHILSFQVAAYDRNKPLIIDPVLDYYVFLGGLEVDYGTRIAVDPDGNALVVGTTLSEDFPTTNAVQAAFGGREGGGGEDGDVFVTKINAAGNAVVFSTYLGGRLADVGNDIAVDANGNAYITGYTHSGSGFPVTPGTLVNPGQGQDVFVVKLGPDGNLIASTRFGGKNDDQALGISLDPAGNVYLAGVTISMFSDGGTNAYPLLNPIQGYLSSEAMAFVTKIDPTLSRIVYSTLIGGSNRWAQAEAIAVDAAGNAYVTGWLNSLGLPVVNAFQPRLSGIGVCFDFDSCADAFVAKIDATGSRFVYCTYFGGSYEDSGISIAVQGNGTAYITGITKSPNFPLTNAVPELSGGGPSDAFVAKFGPTGALQFSTYLGGSGYDRGTGIAVDSSGNLYVTGDTSSIDYPGATDPQAVYGGGDYDAFVAKLKPPGYTLDFASYLGGPGSDRGHGIALDRTNNIYVVGETDSAYTLAVTNDVLLGRGGKTDAFIAKIPQVPDLAVVALEVIQTIQDWSNSVPLIEGKETWVRAHLQLVRNFGVAFTGDIHLRGYDPAGNELPLSPLQASNSLTLAIADNQAIARRNNFDDSLNFQLPFSWTKGTVRLFLVRDQEPLVCSDPAEAGGAPNDCSVQVTFTPEAVPRIRFFNVRWTDAGGVEHSVTDAQVRELAERLLAIYPAPDIRWRTDEIRWNDSTPPDAKEVTSRLKTKWLLDFLLAPLLAPFTAFDPAEIYYGAIPRDDTPVGGRLGRSVGIPGPVAGGFVRTDRLRQRHIHSHEIGHCLGRPHATAAVFGQGCGAGFKQGACGECAALAATDFPFFFTIGAQQRAGLGPMNNGENALIYGLDTDALRHHDFPTPVVAPNGNPIVDPHTTFELMSYCASNPFDKWISRVTYEELMLAINERFNGIFRPPFLRMFSSQPEAGPYLMIRGEVDLDTDSVAFQPFSTLSSRVVPPDMPLGEYSLRLSDARGNLLQEIPFEPSRYEDQEAGPELGAFYFFVAANPAIKQCAVLHHDAIIGALSASPSAPVINILYPRGGEQLDNSTAVLKWSASDLDGDVLTFTIMYSADGGSNWNTLAVDWPAQSYTIDTALLRATDRGLIRVVASDGFNSATAESGGVFSVPNHPPKAFIRSPQEGDIFRGQTFILLDGGALDREEGALSDSNLVWTSSIDGMLGTGNPLEIAATKLSDGKHILTLTATDSARAMATNSVSIQVTRALAPSSAALVVVADHPPAQITTGSPLDFTFVIRNQGLSPATNTMLKFSGNFVCETASTSGADTNCLDAQMNFTTSAGTLASGATISIAVTVPPLAPGLLSGVATVTTDSTNAISFKNSIIVSTHIVPPLGPQLSIVGRAPFGLRLNGAQTTAYRIEATTNLVNWSPLATNTANGGIFDFYDPQSTNLTRRFYRAVRQP